MCWYARKRNIAAPALFQSGDRDVSTGTIGLVFFVFLTFSLAALTQSGCGGASTAAKTLSIAAPSITTQPTSRSVTTGQTATFTVVATGAAPLSYQWQKNGTAISGAMSSSYTTPPTTTSDNRAQFTVVVSNSAGSVASNSATLTVNNILAPTVTFSANPATLAQGQSSTLSWSTTNATSVSIDNGIGAVAIGGSFTVSPTATTTYTLTATGPGETTTAAVTVTVGSSTVQHFEYVLPDQDLYVYDMDNNFQFVKHVSIPQVQGIRGVGAVPSTHMLYISYGQFGGDNVSVPGSLLKYDLLADSVVWTKSYSFGVDSFAITPHGSTIYMPDGENSGDGIWYIIDPATGNVTGNINTGWNGPHDTVTSLDGAYVFMGPHQSPELVEDSTSTNTVLRNIGPLDKSVGPHTINGKHTFSFITETGLFGFQVSDTTTGAVLYTVPVPGFSIPSGFSLDTPCHGISLSPDEKEIYLIDTANAFAHVFDVSGLPSTAPALVASVKLTTTFTGNQSPCLYDCGREGWIRHTRDGQYVLVGDSGNAINTSTRQVIATLPQLFNTRMFVEIDWQNGSPISTTTRQGMGYVTQ
jgi:Ig-like domain-containing protein